MTGYLMKFHRILVAVLAVASAATFARAQQPREFVPQGMEALRQKASSKTEFALDHSMLVFASKLDSDNDDLRRVIAGVSSVSVHSYRFHGAAMYDPEVLESVKQEYKAEGWKHLGDSHEHGGRPGATDVWVHLDNNAISNIAILVARANDVTLVEVSGSISPVDLLHLGGHFGIPKIEGGLTVPR